jgi:hypothetical protein
VQVTVNHLVVGSIPACGANLGVRMIDESHLPVSEQSLVFRLRKRAEIRKQISERKSVQEGKPDRIAALLEEAADRIEFLERGQDGNAAD